MEGLLVLGLRFRPEEDDIWIDVSEPEFPRGRIALEDHVHAAKSVIRALLAGLATQTRYSFGRCGEYSFGSDEFWGEAAVWRAIDLAGRAKSRHPMLRPLWTEVCALINRDDVWSAVERVAASLVACEELLGCEVEEIVQHSAPNCVR